MHPSLAPMSRSSSVRSASILNTLSRKSGKERSSTTPFMTDMATWVWVFTIPGITMSPDASISSSNPPSYLPPTERILSPSTATSPLSTLRSGSWVTIHPSRMTLIMSRPRGSHYISGI